MAISEKKGQGWKAIPTQCEGRPAIYWLQSWPPFCSAATQKGKGEMGREAHLNYYARAYNWGRQLLHHNDKLSSKL